MLPGLSRPGIATVLPGENKRWLLLDSGATVDCSAANLAQFAIMGATYARTTLGIDSPKVGLLSNGTEEGKGNRATQEAYQLIREIKGLNFIGNVEGHDLFSDRVDVVICDGFMGNIVLKTSERLAKMMSSMIKRTLLSRTIWKIGAAICKNAFKEVKKNTDASEVGGAPLLGVNGCCVIGHGNSDAHAVANGIRAVAKLISENVNASIVEQVHNANLDTLS
jgi:glycerol-3-phosphate acyltransferase PlsX